MNILAIRTRVQYAITLLTKNTRYTPLPSHPPVILPLSMFQTPTSLLYRKSHCQLRELLHMLRETFHQYPISPPLHYGVRIRKDITHLKGEDSSLVINIHPILHCMYVMIVITGETVMRRITFRSETCWVTGVCPRHVIGSSTAHTDDEEEGLYQHERDPKYSTLGCREEEPPWMWRRTTHFRLDIFAGMSQYSFASFTAQLVSVSSASVSMKTMAGVVFLATKAVISYSPNHHQRSNI